MGSSYRSLRGRWVEFTNVEIHNELNDDSYIDETKSTLVERLEDWGTNTLVRGRDIKSRSGVLLGRTYSLEVADLKKIANKNLSSDQRVHIVEHAKISAIIDMQSRYDFLTKEERERLTILKRSAAWHNFENKLKG